MRVLVLLCLVAVGAIPAQAKARSEKVEQAAGFVFYSSFWLNLHHTLYAAAWAQRPHTSARPRAEPLPEPLEGPLTSKERAAWTAAIAYYNRQLADRDLLFDDEMSAIKNALTSAHARLPRTGLPRGLRDVLLKAAPVYRRYWWAKHDQKNRAWIADVVPRLTMLAPEVEPRLAKLMLKPWFAQPVRVDVVWVGKIQGAYTSIDPYIHTVASSGSPNEQQWAAVETLFHEASHGLIFPIRDRIDTAAKASGKQTEDLWHVVLFWTAGEVVREALERHHIEYKQYIYATGLFQRAWPQFQKPVETEWAPYVAGKISVDEAVKKLVAAI